MALLVSALNKISQTKGLKYLTGPHAPAAIGVVTTLSCVTKDAVNCAYYVYQSLNNEKIPDDKRNFVAGLDLANGILNVVVQTGASCLLNKNISKFFDNKLAPKWFSPNMASQLIAEGLDAQKATALVEKYKLGAKAGLIAFSTLLVTQVLVKRVVVPLIATPMATYFKNHFDKKQGKCPNGPQFAGDTVKITGKVPAREQAVVSNSGNINKQENLPDCFHHFVK